MRPVLVACPTFAGKAYALDRYLASYRALDYQPRSLLLVDNTADADDAGRYAGVIRSKLLPGEDVIHIEPKATLHKTLAASWAVIVARAEATGVEVILSLEQDIIVEPKALRVLMAIRDTLRLSYIAHAYYPRGGCEPGWAYSDGLGCTLIVRQRAAIAVAEADKGLCGFESSVYWDGAKACVADLFAIEHLSGGEADYWPFEGNDGRRNDHLTSTTGATR